MSTKSIQIIPYLMFEGNCEEALNFYQKTIGGTLTVVNRYDNPAMNAPASSKDKILHARWEFDGGALFGSDAFPGKGTKKNSGDVSLSLILNDLEKAKQVYHLLSEGGIATMPFEKQFWGDWHGNLVIGTGLAGTLTSKKRNNRSSKQWRGLPRGGFFFICKGTMSLLVICKTCW